MRGVANNGPADQDLMASPEHAGADSGAQRDELGALRAERDALAEELEAARAEIELLSARIAVTVARDEHAIEALTQAAVKSGELQQEIDALRRSMSWRVTSVLRWVSRKARGLARRVVRRALSR